VRPKTFFLARVAVLAASLALAACSPAVDRPLHGAVPGSPLTNSSGPGVPPTIAPSFKPIGGSEASPSPGIGLSPVPSPSAVLPPIVRTIAPAANGTVPSGAPVTVSAVLVSRGADLATVQLLVDGADTAAEPEKATPVQWTVSISKPLPDGQHQARVLVRDAAGGTGGFTWTFTVGAAASPGPSPAPAVKPAPSPTT
jgi:hypothetical protein